MIPASRFSALVRLVLIPMGLAFLVAALFTYNKSNEFVSGAVGTQGTVVSTQEVDTAEGKMQRTTVRFEAMDGTLVRFTSDAKRGSDYQPGETVSVLYRPDRPGEARIESFAALWGRAAILGGIGAGVLVMGLILKRGTRRLNLPTAPR